MARIDAFTRLPAAPAGAGRSAAEAPPARASAAERVAFVDHAKGLCILLVVMMHSTLGLGEAVAREGWLHEVVAFARPFRMPDFFLIAGLFLSRSIDKPWRAFLDAKLLHFAYFYVLWLLIQAGVKLPGLALADPLAFGRELAFALVEPYGTLWFIHLLPVLFLAARGLRRAPPLAVIVGASALQIAGVHTGWTVVDEFCGRAVYFAAGWLLAPGVFALARAAAAHPLRALAGLELWALANGAAVEFGVAALPGVSLALGAMGACAVVTGAALLARLPWTAPLAALGRHSLVVYLVFFLPMAATRTLLLKFGFVAPLGPLDVGTASAVITAVAVLVPLALHALVRGTALRFLFVRPGALRLG